MEKVYVGLGNDLQEGYKTLDWTLKKWKSNSITVVILHLTHNLSQDFVYTPFGKLPASSVSEEKLEVLTKYEQEKMERLLSKYIAFCGQVKAEIRKVEKSDEPIHKVIVDLISRQKIKKLVMGLAFMKASSWRSKTATSSLLYIQQHKPSFCEFCIVWGGKMMFLKEENDEVRIENDQGVPITKKGSFKGWLGKMFAESSSRNSTHGLDSSSSQDQWQKNAQEIEDYFKYLTSLNLDAEICEEEKDVFQNNSTEPDLPELDDSTMSVAAKVESMKRKIDEAQKIVQLKKEETKANAERSAKAEWAISLCNTQVEKLDAGIKEETARRIEITNDIDSEKEQIQDILSYVQESRNRLTYLRELQLELSNKLQLSTVTRSHMETELEKAVIARAEMVREIEELRRQRDVIQRRIEFCKEKDAIGMATKLSEQSCSCRDYSAEDIRLATDDFSEILRLKSGGDWTNVYRGRINNTTVAIKILPSESQLSPEDFLTKMKILNSIRHPHLICMIGFCSEIKCIVFEYMQNGSLRDILFSAQGSLKKVNRSLPWHARLRIAHEVASGLAYLHSAQPKPLIHGHLTAGNILLDRNLVSKISGFSLNPDSDVRDQRPDIRALGVILLNLLTGRNWLGLVEEAVSKDRTALVRVLDKKAGRWPIELAEELVEVAMKCMAVYGEHNSEMRVARVVVKLDELRRKGDEVVANDGNQVAEDENFVAEENSIEVPSIFMCPILQDVMKDPYLAADGFSYELEAIDAWLKMGRDTSPMTNLKLKHKSLTPNHTLRFLIQDWQTKKSNVPA